MKYLLILGIGSIISCSDTSGIPIKYESLNGKSYTEYMDPEDMIRIDK